jgi:hypothetical protein
MTRLVVFDLTHYEMVYMWLRVLEPLNWHVSLITSQNIANKLVSAGINNNGSIKIIIGEPGKLKLAFSEIKNDNIFIFNTIDNNYQEVSKCIKQLSKAPKLVTIHNLKTWLNPPFTLNRKALANYYFRWGILKKMSGIVVLDSTFIKYVRKHTNPMLYVFDAPYTLLEENNQYKSGNILHVGIPGNIDGNSSQRLHFLYKDHRRFIEFRNCCKIHFCG